MNKTNVFLSRSLYRVSLGKVAWVSAAVVLTVLSRYDGGTAQGVTIEPLYRFTTDASPQGKLLENGAGTYYGTTSMGGANGLGTVFVVNSSGNLTTLASFAGANGANPYSELTRGSDGNLYGTTLNGGSANLGTVYRVTPGGTITTLVSFTGANGSNPRSGVVRGTDGNFYGVTFKGGSRGFGTVYKITPAGQLTTLTSFTEANGANPDGVLVQSDGNFYGTTSAGGKSGNGTVFRITPAGALTSLFSFNGNNGSAPIAGLVRGANGHFYGTASSGGQSGKGVVFEVTSQGALTRAVSLDPSIGSNPNGQLLLGADGNFYGTAKEGGTVGYGTVFRMSPSGALANLASFQVSICAYPTSGLIQGSDGYLYGTTAFGGWGSGSVYRFSLNSNPNRPVVTITAPQSNERFTNAAITARGTAQSTTGLEAVWYKLNSGAWTKATTTDSWASWSTPLTLTAAANVLSAYSVDPSGNVSDIKSVSFVYPGGSSSEALTIVTNGPGKVVRGFSGVPVVGRTYTVTAVAKAGAAFIGWTGDVMSPNARISFVMQPTTTLIAHFRQGAKPSLVITAPKNNATVKESGVTFAGTARDNGGIQTITYQLNGGEWQPLSGPWATWSVPVTLEPGTNQLAMQAVDSSGSLSALTMRKVFYQVTSPLTLTTSGLGRVTPALNGKTLNVGKSYKVTAVPASSQWVFNDWSGSMTSSVAALSFVMETNMTLQASFVTNPFPAVQGVYNGLFFANTNADIASSGSFKLTLAASGTFSGKVQIGNAVSPFSGRFNAGGIANGVVARNGNSRLTLNMQLNFVEQQIVGDVSNGTWTSPLLANRNVFSAANRATNAGKYTMVIPGSTDTNASPGGDGVGRIIIDSLGNIQLAGNLADGNAVSQKTTISREGLWPLYVSVNKGKGIIMSWASFGTNSSAPSGDLLWISSPNATKLYPNGFTNVVPIVGSSYVFTKGTPVLNFTNGIIQLTGGNLSNPITSDVTWGADNIIRFVGATNKITAKLNTGTGAVTGSFFNPETRKTVPFQAVVLENQNSASGYFLGSSQSGRAIIQSKSSPSDGGAGTNSAALTSQ